MAHILIVTFHFEFLFSKLKYYIYSTDSTISFFLPSFLSFFLFLSLPSFPPSFLSFLSFSLSFFLSLSYIFPVNLLTIINFHATNQQAGNWFRVCRQWFPSEEEAAGFSMWEAKSFTYWHPLPGVLKFINALQMHVEFFIFFFFQTSLLKYNCLTIVC